MSEGIFWDYTENGIAQSLLNFYGIDQSLLAPLVPCFGEQGRLQSEAAGLLGIAAGTPVCYRAGDQPNNAFSLQVLEPGEIAATAGTSGVLYGVSDRAAYDAASRVNPFVHVNHQPKTPRYGVLMCLNGTGILNSWLRREFFTGESYETMNAGAVLEPMERREYFAIRLETELNEFWKIKIPVAISKAWILTGTTNIIWRAPPREGIVFSLVFGAEIMQEMGLSLSRIRAGYANMFLSGLFSQTFADLIDCPVELYNSDGAVGAARGAGYGSGYYPQIADCFRGMKIIQNIEPDKKHQAQIRGIYSKWKDGLAKIIEA